MKRLDLTDDQHAALMGVLRERLELCKAQRAELVAAGATRGLIKMGDAAITSLSELAVACGLAVEIAPAVSMAATLERLRRSGGLPDDESSEEMLQRALGVGPVAALDHIVLPAPGGGLMTVVEYEKLVRDDESGATGTQRSDWGERGEGDEKP
jgi:hypothetical protein